MQNKKQATIIASIAIILFAATAFVFLYEPARNAIIKNNQIEQVELDEVTGDLPVLECKYENDQKSYKYAIETKDINSCDCIKKEVLKEKCKSATMDASFYERALNQLDESLCDSINSEIQKDACHQVVKSSIEKMEVNNPQYLANIYSKAHNEKAIIEYEKLTETDKENINNYISLALSYAEKGLTQQEQGNNQTPYVDKAFEAIENAKKIDDKNSEVYRVEGYINEIKPDYTQAMLMYDKALEIDNSNMSAHTGKGHTYRIMGVLEGAVEEFNTAAKLDGNRTNIVIYTNLCNLEYSRSNYEEAIKNCKIVTQMDNADPVFQSEAYQIMASIFIDKKDPQQAKNYLLKAKTITPNDPNLYVAFSEFNFTQENYKEAENDANKAIELSPTKAVSYLKLSYALYMQEKYNEAIEEAQKGIALVKEDVSLLTASKPATERDLNYAIANSYRQLGNTQKEKEYNQKAEDAFENGNSLNINE
ncbi:MAG: tetratricopeptide repeat protein [Candidatus Moraniibacteriota bacterium]|jgi:tetratricopeptide (TPR) repeat protein